VECFEFLEIGLPREILRRTFLPERDIRGFAHLRDEGKDATTELGFGWGLGLGGWRAFRRKRIHKHTCFLGKKSRARQTVRLVVACSLGNL